MKLDKVYIGFTKDGKEHLFYKKTKFYDFDRNMTIFYDLENDTKYTYAEIDTNTLLPFTSEFHINQNKCLKDRIIKYYKKSRNKFIFLDDESLIPVTYRKVLENKYKNK